MRLRHGRRRPAGGRGDDRWRRMSARRADAVRHGVRVPDQAYERRIAGQARPVHRRRRQRVLGGQPERVRRAGRQHLDRAGRARPAPRGAPGRRAPRECRRARVQEGRGERHPLLSDQRGLRSRQGRRGGGGRYDRLQGHAPRDPDRPGDGRVQHTRRRDLCGWNVLGTAAHGFCRVVRLPVHGRRRTGGARARAASSRTGYPSTKDGPAGEHARFGSETRSSSWRTWTKTLAR